MKKTLIVCCCLSVDLVCAQNQPPPLEIANAVSNFWVNNNFSNLTVYATNLYSGTATNYLPAILVSAFHDSVFLGVLQSASNKLDRVQNYVANTPQAFSDSFKAYLTELIKEVNMEIDLYVNAGRTPSDVQAHASPQAVRSASGDMILPDISILYNTPAIIFP